VHPAVTLGQKPETFLIRQPAERRLVRADAADLSHPGIVVQRIDDACCTRVSVNRDEPAVFVVGRARVGDRDRAVR
jgi:hypothetical protein